MEKIREYLDEIDKMSEKFSKIDSKWKSIIYSKKDDEKFESLEDELEDFYFSAVKFVIETNEDFDKFNEDVSLILGKKAFVGLYKKMQSMIRIFRTMQDLSKKSDPAMFIMECFNKAILRRDPDFSKDEWQNYGFDSEQKMSAAISVISAIVWNHTHMEYCKKTAKKEFKMLTDLDDSCCAVYAEIFDRHFNELRMKMLMNDQEEILSNIQILVNVLTNEREQ
ncbi:hypothetical protein SAMN02745247_01535 [Butyrivibrio hungatei DSM 14810]|uniref:Uncharacterized protein n=1 Tax=Butyrivibrio hungatei DSM 14810 TaxID=1121132 RepID=A0A1M7SDM4_9FIRM|nr:hypothetical protein [Butyrivibrio hungatei]SHN56611.1 hypothetical protein SAMN02745247_01535 [Butyrivibrio hungatei DSM 14810]